jgi:ketol-acid reductoisomerase
MYEGGLTKMRWSVSETAEWGDYLTGPRIITDTTRAEMVRVLAEIRDGSFSDRRVTEYHAGLPNYHEFRKASTNQLLETTGRRLRGLMSWVGQEGTEGQ